VCCDAGRIRRTLRGDAVTAGAPDLRVPRGRGASSGTKDPVGGVDCSCLWAGNPGHFILGEQVLIEKNNGFQESWLEAHTKGHAGFVGGGCQRCSCACGGRGGQRVDTSRR
jgi:hypothetical protein